jgi:hypothetical protein
MATVMLGVAKTQSSALQVHFFRFGSLGTAQRTRHKVSFRAKTGSFPLRRTGMRCGRKMPFASQHGMAGGGRRGERWVSVDYAQRRQPGTEGEEGSVPVGLCDRLCQQRRCSALMRSNQLGFVSSPVSPRAIQASALPPTSESRGPARKLATAVLGSSDGRIARPGGHRPGTAQGESA